MCVGFGLSNVTFRPSLVFHSRDFSYPSVDTDEQSTGSCPHFYWTFKMLWQIFRADNVFCTLLGPISLLHKQLFTVHAVEIFHCTIRFINQISKEVPHETCILYLFHKNVHENTFALTLPCFIWVSRAIAKHAPHRSYCFLSLFKLRCKRHYRNLATYSWCTTWRENVTKTAPARRQHSVGCGGAPISYDRRRRQNVHGGWKTFRNHNVGPTLLLRNVFMKHFCL